MISTLHTFSIIYDEYHNINFGDEYLNIKNNYEIITNVYAVMQSNHVYYPPK